MSPVVLVLLVAGADRLLASGRLPVLRRTRDWWLDARPRLIAFLRSAPATYGYLAILVVTTWVLASASERIANRLLLAQSTNLHQLARDPARVLVSSAFWLGGRGDIVIWAALLTLVLAPVERRVGSWRMSVVFAIGHVGATLLTAAGLWAAIHVDAVERSVANARDVGASYGTLAVAGALTYLLEPRLRVAYAAVLVGVVAVLAGVFQSFTDFGHLLAVLLGLACYGVVRGRSARPLVTLPGARLLLGALPYRRSS